jgi:CHASE3 domain sensor protein
MVNTQTGIGKEFDRPLVLGIVLVLGLILASAAISAYNVHRLREDSERVDHTYQVILHLEAVMEEVRDAESGQRAYVITGEPSYLDPYRGAPKLVENRVQQIAELTADNPQQQARIAELRKHVADRLDTLFKNAELRESQGFDAAQEAIATNAGREQMQALRDTINAMQAEERGLLIRRSAVATQMYYTTMASLLLGTLLGLLSIVSFLWILRKYWVDRAAAADEIFDQREHLRTTLSSIGDAVIATDAEARIEFINPIAANLTGWSADDAKGRR